MKKLASTVVLFLCISQVAFSTKSEDIKEEVVATQQKTTPAETETMLSWIKNNPKKTAALITAILTTTAAGVYVHARSWCNNQTYTACIKEIATSAKEGFDALRQDIQEYHTNHPYKTKIYIS